jgi:phosphoribosyl 1,2-cyclic phosphodiesterase
MKIKPIASSSKGNCYIVESNGKQLILDCGIPLKRIREALNHDLSNVVGCLVSHSHGDHAKYLPQLERETSIPIWCNRSTKDSLSLNTDLVYTIIDDWMGNEYFTFLPVEFVHDVPNYGFLISDGQKRLFYATDTGEVNYQIKGLTHLMIESNYSFEQLTESEHNPALVKRICENHLGIDEVVDFVKRHPNLEEIHLLHLSSRHSNAEEFKRMVQDVSGCPTFVAGE